MIRRIRSTTSEPSPDVHAPNKMLPLILRWDYDRPVLCSVTKWRRTQVQRYMKIHPQAKDKEIKEWTFSITLILS